MSNAPISSASRRWDTIQIILEGVDRLSEPSQLGAQEPQVTLFRGIVRIESGQPALDGKYRRNVLCVPVDRFEVSQYPRHDNRDRARGCERIRESDRLPRQFREQTLAARPIVHRPGMEGVNKPGAAAVHDSEHEVQREIHADHRQTELLGDRPVKHR